MTTPPPSPDPALPPGPDPPWDTVSVVFAAALDVPDHDRRAWLSRLPDVDERVRLEVSSLLAARERAGDFLEFGAIMPGDLGVGDPFAEADSATLVGTRVGPWTLDAELGRGGMGTVYLATRADQQYRQRVALKLIRPGRVSEESISRFRRERQILAGLEHPNIARLVDGGTTDEGLPYLAMEFVDGRHLYDYCSASGLSLDARLALFLEICDAVDHAHQSLVLHRDIKPGNILVAADGTPKLLDFGIAKIFDDSSEADTEGVETIGAFTPEYASPEQVLGKPLTTSSDVYSLGAILYELISGRPLDDGSRATTSQRAIAGDAPGPPKPSTALGATAPPARHRKVPNPPPGRKPELRRRLSGDLDTIVLKALSQDPSRRYRAASDLASDIRRYQKGLPIDARPDSWRYRTGKFIRRNRVTVGLSALAVLGLAVGLLAALWQASVARRERAVAERRFDDVHEMSESLVFDLYDAIRNVPGTLAAQELLLSRTLKFLDRLGADASADSALQLDTADAYERIGAIQAGDGPNLRKGEDALANYHKARALREMVLREDSTNVRALFALASALSRLAFHQLYELNDPVASLESNRRGVAMMERLAARDPGNEAYLRRLSSMRNHLGLVLGQNGRQREGLVLIGQALDTMTALVQRRPGDAAHRQARVDITLGYAPFLAELNGMSDSARAIAQIACDHYDVLLRASPDNMRALHYAYGAWYQIADIDFTARGDARRALSEIARAESICAELRRREPSDLWTAFALPGCRVMEAKIRLALGQDRDRAEAALRTNLDALREVARQDTANLMLRGSQRHALEGLGVVAMARAQEAPAGAAALGHWRKAREWFREARRTVDLRSPGIETEGVSFRQEAQLDTFMASCDSALVGR